MNAAEASTTALKIIVKSVWTQMARLSVFAKKNTECFNQLAYVSFALLYAESHILLLYVFLILSYSHLLYTWRSLYYACHLNLCLDGCCLHLYKKTPEEKKVG